MQSGATDGRDEGRISSNVQQVHTSSTNGTETLDTFIQVTTPAKTLISKITDRMPAILQPDDWATWLGEIDASPANVKAVLRTFEDGGNWTMTEQEPARKSKPSKPDPQRGCFRTIGPRAN